MELQDILSVGLTAEDFNMIIEGIDAIPEKGVAGELIREIMIMMVTPDGRRDNYKNEMSRRIRESQQKMNSRKDDFTILKGKLILLKRLLLTNAGIQAANDILNKR